MVPTGLEIYVVRACIFPSEMIVVTTSVILDSVRMVPVTVLKAMQAHHVTNVLLATSGGHPTTA